MKFTEINYQGNLKGTDYMWGVHVTGCADIDKEIKRTFGRDAKQDPETYKYVTDDHEATTMRELLDSIIDNETRELGWHDDNVKVHNCVRQAFAGTRVTSMKRTGAAATASKKESTTMSATKTVKPAVAVKSTKTTKPAAKQELVTKTGTRVKGDRQTIGDAALKALVTKLVKGGKVASKSAATKAIRAQGISVKGSRVRSMFIAINKSSKRSSK